MHSARVFSSQPTVRYNALHTKNNVIYVKLVAVEQLDNHLWIQPYIILKTPRGVKC